jgi:hypothetical protein
MGMATYCNQKKVNQNEAIFNFLEHNSLILNEWAVSGDGKDYMKLEPNLSTEIESMEKEVDDGKKEVGGKKAICLAEGYNGKEGRSSQKGREGNASKQGKTGELCQLFTFSQKIQNTDSLGNV